MRIKITAGGIFGQPTKENPSGELAIGTELKVDKAPVGWAGRYIDLDADQPVSEDTEALKARIADLEDENAKLKGATPEPTLPEGPYEAKDLNGGWWGILGKDDAKVGKSVRKDEAEAFNKLDDAGKAKAAEEHFKAV